MPDLQLVLSLTVNLVRTAASDELHGSFEGNVIGWCEEKMKVIRRYNKFMQSICAFFSVAKKTLNHNSGIFGQLEQLATPPGLRCNEVGASWSSSMF